ncbi:unnamed protein product, partial [Mycena citricolor]
PPRVSPACRPSLAESIDHFRISWSSHMSTVAPPPPAASRLTSSIYETHIIRLKTLIRPGDVLKVVLPAFVAPVQRSSAAAEEERIKQYALDGQRIVAVISHTEPDGNGKEEGSVFVFGLNPQSSVLRTYPIYGGFSISMAQVSPKEGSGMSLTLKHESEVQVKGDEPMTLYCAPDSHSIDKLKEVLAECRRLKGSSDAEPPTSPLSPSSAAAALTTFSWLAPYSSPRPTLTPSSPSFLADSSTIPPDLRTKSQPLPERLSNASAGAPGDDAADISLIREDWMRQRRRDQRARNEKKDLRIRMGTFNVNGTLPSHDLAPWFGASGTVPRLENDNDNVDAASTANLKSSPVPRIPSLEDVSPFSVPLPADDDEEEKNPFDDPVFTDPASPVADIYVLGFQELDLSAEALLYASGSAKEEAWTAAVFAGLGAQRDSYVKIASKQLVGLLLLVIVHRDLVSSIDDIRSVSAGVGIMGLMGNKGGVAIRLRYTPPSSQSSTILTFVNSHLAAFDEMFEKRNADYHELCRKLVFNLSTSSSAPAAGGQLPELAVTCNVFETDVLFWMGDLNYRISAPDPDVRTILAASEWDSSRYETLLGYDQLRQAMRDGKAFVGFTEAPLRYFPTYRFNTGLLRDDLGYDLKRRPAWCDRILYMSDLEVTTVKYQAYHTVQGSDHRPVGGEYVVRVDIQSEEGNALELSNLLDGLGEARGSLKVSDSVLDLGHISLGSKIIREVTIENTSPVPCSYRLVQIDSDSDPHPEWLHVEPAVAVLLPSSSLTLTVCCSVSAVTAAELNRRHMFSREIECTLILHTILSAGMGKDHFVRVCGYWEPTCFATPLTTLILLPGSIRSVKSAADLFTAARGINAPREVMRLVNWMMGAEVELSKLFTTPANITEIRECLDTGSEFPTDVSSLAIAETLVQLLAALPQPLIRPELQLKWFGVDGLVVDRDEAFELLDQMSPVEVNVWISITAFLHYVAQGSQTRVQELASIFTPVLLGDPILGVSPVARRRFLLLFISA